MNKKEHIKQVALTAAIIADFISAALFMNLFERIETPYMTGIDHIADWAIEFTKLHRNTNWNEVKKKGIKPLSKYYQIIYLFEDACGDYAYYKLDNMNRDKMRVVK